MFCIDVALIAVVVVSWVGLPRLQVLICAHDYILASGNIQADQQIVWIIDLTRVFQTSTADRVR